MGLVIYAPNCYEISGNAPEAAAPANTWRRYGSPMDGDMDGEALADRLFIAPISNVTIAVLPRRHESRPFKHSTLHCVTLSTHVTMFIY